MIRIAQRFICRPVGFCSILVLCHLVASAAPLQLISTSSQSSAPGVGGDSIPWGVSTNGRYVLFESIATDLVVGDTNNASDIFVRDLAGGTTALVSVSTNGGVGNGLSRSSVFTPDGRCVAFVSEANNLVGSDTNKLADVFLRDLPSGT